MKQKKWTTQLQLLHKAKESTQQLTMSTHNSTDHTNIHRQNPDLMVLNQEKWAIIVDIDIAVSFEGNLDTSKEAREAKLDTWLQASFYSIYLNAFMEQNKLNMF